MRPNVLALILAGGGGARMGPLCSNRAKPLLPFLGQYRIIDFTLWNALQSDIWDVAVIADHDQGSVRDYLGEWPRCLSPSGTNYRGTADAIYHNLGYVFQQGADVVLILEADQVYRMDYRPLLKNHLDNEVGVTVGLVPVPQSTCEFSDRPNHRQIDFTSMGVYAFSAAYLSQVLERDAPDADSVHDLSASIIPVAAKERQADGYVFDGYWREIGTVESYHEANLQCLMEPEARRQIGPPRSPTTSHQVAIDDESYISTGATVRGDVYRSVIGSGVTVERGAMVVESVVMDRVYVGKDSLLERAVLDEQAWIGEGSWIGVDPPWERDQGEVSVVGRGAVIPPGSWVPPNSGIYRERGSNPVFELPSETVRL